MPIAIKIKELRPHLDLASKFVAVRDIVPALKYLYFKGNTIRAYSGVSGVVCATEWDFGQEGFAVPAASIMKLVTSFDEQGREELELKFDSPGKPLIVKCGKSRASLPTLEVDQLSEFVLREPPSTKRTPLAWEFWSDLERVYLSVGQDETKPALRGVYWAPSGHLISSDSKRVTLVTPVKDRLWTPPSRTGVLLPDYLLACLGSFKMKVESIAVEENVVWFFTAGASMWGAIIDATFPWDRCIEIMKEVRKKVVTPGQGTWVGLEDDGRAQLRASLDRPLYFSDSILNAIKGFITNDTLTITTGESSEVQKAAGFAEEILAVKTQGPGGEFLIDGKLLQQALGMPGNTRFWFSGQAPLYFFGEDRRLEHIIVLLVGPEAQSAPEPEDDESY